MVSETAAVLPPDSAFIRQGLYNLDPKRLGFGYGVNGAMAPFVRVPARCLHHVPASLALEKAALTEPCCVAYNAVCVNSRLRPGDTVAVIGPGPIGLLCAMMAKLSGAGHLIVIGIPADAQAARGRQARSAPTRCWARKAKMLPNGSGILATATGSTWSSMRPAFPRRSNWRSILSGPAGQITKVGWGPQPLNFSLDPLVQKAVTLQGSFSHNWPIWEKVISLLASGKIDLDPILNRISPLERMARGLRGDAFRRNRQRSAPAMTTNRKLRLKDKVILVTGSTTGIGEGMVRIFAREGAKVMIHGRRKDAAQKLAAEIGRSERPSVIGALEDPQVPAQADRGNRSAILDGSMAW